MQRREAMMQRIGMILCGCIAMLAAISCSNDTQPNTPAPDAPPTMGTVGAACTVMLNANSRPTYNDGFCPMPTLCFPATMGATMGTCTFAVCPTAQGKTLNSLADVDANLFKTSCVGCHGPTPPTGPAGGMDLSSTDLAVIKSTVLGMKTSKAVTADLPRIKPGDPDGSLLIHKLSITNGSAGSPTTADPTYGNGMPLSFPGSVCPQTLAALRAWIQAGTGLQ